MKRAWWPPFIVWVAFFILYAATAAPSLVELFDDSLEFQLVAPSFGIAHPTGYPLYVIAGGLWSRVIFPFGNWAWRMNLFSALAAACAVALIFALARRLARLVCGRSDLWAGLAAAASFGLGPIWWAQATVAEVYALHSLLTAATLYFGFGVLDFGARGCSAEHKQSWNNSITRYTPEIQNPRFKFQNDRVLILCAISGLGLAHHRTIVLVLPALAIYLLYNATWIRRPRGAWAIWCLALVAPLLLYLWLPLRAAQGVRDLHGSYVNTWTGFWNHVLATGYTGFFETNPLALSESILDWIALWRQQMGLAGILVGGLGLVSTLAASTANKKCSGTPPPVEAGAAGVHAMGRELLSKPWIYLSFILVANVLFAINYQVSDAEVFLLPALLTFALFTGGGVAFIGCWIQRGFRQRRPEGTRLWTWAAGAAQTLCVLLLALGIGGRGPAVNRSQDWAIHDYAVALAKVNFPPGSHVVALEGEATSLQYMQQAEGLAHNATAIVADQPEQRRQIIADLVTQGAPIYLTRELNGIEQQYSFSGEGPLVRVWPRGQAQTGAPMTPAEAIFAAGQLRLEGYDLVILDGAGGPAVQIAFYWQPTTTLTQTLKVSLRLQYSDGSPVLWPDGSPVQADHYPLRLVAKTTDWLAGEVIRDVHVLPIPAVQQSQPRWLHIILYDEQTLTEAGAWQVAINH